ncbi:MAG: hypothetical protein ACTHMC_01310 [Pseudobacter sp.]|uniref:hypothetical protein n=1 Tax=Pseudobacter sp. TaxID=2045420 RepID=UPI003F81DC71
MTIEQSNDNILLLLKAGKTLKEISGIAHLSIPAIKKRLKKLRDKYGCANTLQLVATLETERSIQKDTDLQSNNA